MENGTRNTPIPAKNIAILHFNLITGPTGPRDIYSQIKTLEKQLDTYELLVYNIFRSLETNGYDSCFIESKIQNLIEYHTYNTIRNLLLCPGQDINDSRITILDDYNWDSTCGEGWESLDHLLKRQKFPYRHLPHNWMH
jgi:hypothetical protein